MMQIPARSASISVASQTAKAQRHKDGSVLLSIPDDRICKLNGVGALTWMVLEESPAGLSIDEVVLKLAEQFDEINAEGQLNYEVTRDRLREDTTRFLTRVAEMNLLQRETDSQGREVYRVKEGVSGTTSSTVAKVATPADTDPTSVTSSITPQKRETIAAFIGLLAFDLLLKFRGFESLINKVEQWPTAEPRTSDLELCRRVRAMVDRAQMYYPKKAMCLQHSAVATCLLRRRGVPAVMILAAQEFPPKGHAWVEVDGKVVNDFKAVQRAYRVMRRV
jgi:transglutaminase superfamily protein/coenzyme PQQ synthesis protein D (PqqD)